MGLSISIGILAQGPDADPEWIASSRRHFKVINRVLKANKLPAHVEPESLPKGMPPRGHGLGGFPYSWIHYLRRAVAYARQAPDEFRPVAEGEDPTEDLRIDRELSVFMDSHFICHSDCEGYYVPIDFPEPLIDDKDKLAGGLLGSSQRALAEVIQAAPLIGIKLRAGKLSGTQARAIAKEDEGGSPYWIERQVWLTMYEAFTASILTGCAVEFG